MNQGITKTGLMLYFSTMDQILKADPTELGLLIQKEMLWLTGKGEEPIIEDPRCDALHSRIKEQILLRERKRQNKEAEKNKKNSETIPTPSNGYDTIEKAFKEKEKVRLNKVVQMNYRGDNEGANRLFNEALEDFGVEDKEVMVKLGKMVTAAAATYAKAKANNVD